MRLVLLVGTIKNAGSNRALSPVGARCIWASVGRRINGFP